MPRRRKMPGPVVFEGPPLERVLAFIESQEATSPPSLREQAIFHHLRAWASSQFPLPRGEDYSRMVPIELIKQGERIVGVKAHV